MMCNTKMSVKDGLEALYQPGTWLMKIQFINQLVLLNHVLISVLAKKGAGKTAFCSLLLGHLDKRIKSVFIDAEDLCNPELLIKDIGMQLNLPVTDNGNLDSLVTQINEKKEPVLVLIDNAENLSKPFVEACAALLNEQGDACFFHLCLVGNDSLANLLNAVMKPEYRDLMHSIALGSLNEQETISYMQHQLHQINPLAGTSLDEEKTKQLYTETQGDIQKIQAFREAHFKTPVLEPQPIHKPSHKKKRLAAAGLSLVFSLVAIVFIQQKAYEGFPTTTQPVQQIQHQPGQLVLHSTIPHWRDNAVIQWVEDVPPRKLIAELHEADAGIEPMALVDKVIVVPSLRKKAELKKATVVAQQQKQSKTLGMKQTTTRQAHRSNLSHTPAYTIQLFATHNKKELYRLQHASKSYGRVKIKYFANGKGGWYVLTLGEFNTKEQALRKVKTLPGSLTKLNPWIRPTAGLKDA